VEARRPPTAVPITSLLNYSVQDNAESIVVSTRAFIDVVMTPMTPLVTSAESPGNPSTPFRRRQNYIWHQFQQGLLLLEQGDLQKAFAHLQSGCSMAEDYLRQPSQQTLISLLMVMGNRQWPRHQQAWKLVLRFMSSMAVKTLGSKHPLSQILRQMNEWTTIHDIAEPVLRILLDIYIKHLGPTDPDVILMKQALSAELMRCGKITESEAVILEACQETSQAHGEASLVRRKCLRRLANLYADQQRWDDAESVFENVVALDSVENDYRGPMDPESVFTCQNLSLLNYRRGDLLKSEYWAQQELDLACKIYGPEDDYYADCLRRKAARNNGESSKKWFSWMEIG
jgi:tetratricopeptide (TPR) repeat protein